MTTKRSTVHLAALTILATSAIARAAIIIDPPAANNVSVPSKSIGALTAQEPVMFTSFGMFGTLTDPRGLTQQILITTEETASMPGGAEDTSIALFNSVGDLLAIGAPGFGVAHSVIDFTLLAGSYFVAVTTPGAVFGDGFSVTPAVTLLPGPYGSYSLRITTIPTPGAIAVASLGFGVAALRRRTRSEGIE